MSRPAPIKNHAPRALAAATAILSAGALGMAAVLSLLSAAGHDQLWFLLMARRWLGGATLYGPEIFDSNPPLVVWLSALSIALGNLLPPPVHDPATFWAKLLVVLVAAAVALLCRRHLASMIGRLTPPADLFLLFSFILIAGILPARDFGQRDQLTGLLCLPYVFASARSSLARRSSPASSRPRRLALTQTFTVLLTALGICLKPQQTLLVVAVETTLLLLWVRDRRAAAQHPGLSSPNPLRRATPWLLLTAGVVYIAAIRLFAPAYLTLALPLLRQTYWAIGHLHTGQLLAEAPELHLLALLSITLYAWQQRSPGSPAAPRTPDPPPASPQSVPGHITASATEREPLRRTTLLLLAAGSGSTLAYHLQGTGWYYQQLPALTFFSAALALALLRPLRRTRSTSRLLPLSAALLSLLAVTLTAWFSRSSLTAPAGIEVLSPDPALFAALPAGSSVAILTTAVEDSMMPVERFHLTWAQRTNNLWLLPAVLRLESSSPSPSHHLSPAEVAALDTLIHRWMIEDLTRWHPTLVLVARCQDTRVTCQELEGRHDDLLQWFARDSEFRVIWQNYRFAQTAGDYDVWMRERPPAR